jgi:hypothetical protein
MDMLIKGWSDEEWNKNRATAAAMVRHALHTTYACTMREGKGASGACLMGAHASSFLQCEGWLLNGV